MTKLNIDKLLNKKGLTGAELGRLAIMRNIQLFKAYHETGKGTTCFTWDEINKAYNNLDEYNKKIYKRYMDLYATINCYFNIGEAMTQQAYHCFFRMIFRLTSLHNALTFRIYQKNLPIMMTQEKYDTLSNNILQNQLTFKETYLDLLISGIQYYMNELYDNEEAKNPLTPFLKKYEGKVLKSKGLIDTYLCEVADNENDKKCYYELYNGNNSNDVTLKEYVEDLLNCDVLKGITDEDRELLRRRVKNQMAGLKDLYKDDDILNKDAFDDLLNREKHLNSNANARQITNVFDIVINYLKGTNREDIAKAVEDYKSETLIIPDEARQIELIDFLYDIWIFRYLGDKKEIYSLIKKEVPEVLEVMQKDIIKQKGLKFLEELKEKDIDKEVISWDVLIKNKIYDYEKRKDTRFTDENPQAENGIAIIKEDTLKGNAYRLKEGIFNTDDSLLSGRGFEKAFTEDQPTLQELNNFKSSMLGMHKHFISALKNMYAFNFFYRDVEQVYKLEGLAKEFGIDTVEITDKFRSLNGYAEIIQQAIWELYKDSPEGLLKDECIKQAVPYIDINEILPDAEQMQKAKELVSDINNFNTGQIYSTKFLYSYIKGSEKTINIIDAGEDDR